MTEIQCLRCEKPFKAPLPEVQSTQLCDRCFGDVMHYIVTSTSLRQVHYRIKAVDRLYAPETPSPSAGWDPDGDALWDEAYDPDFDPTDTQIAADRPVGPSIMEQHKAAWDQKVGWM